MKTKFVTELFNKKFHIIKDFTCGVEELDYYLKEKAGQEIKKNVSAVYVLRESDNYKIIGYFTLSSYSIKLKELPLTLTKRLPKYHSLPALLLGRLAVDAVYQGKGIGEYLLIDALKRSYEFSKQIGSFAVILDVKDKKVKRFYEKYGFITFSQKPMTLYLPMTSIKKLIS
jgi:GNAT superfamily N-acetyltransferase